MDTFDLLICCFPYTFPHTTFVPVGLPSCLFISVRSTRLPVVRLFFGCSVLYRLFRSRYGTVGYVPISIICTHMGGTLDYVVQTLVPPPFVICSLGDPFDSFSSWFSPANPSRSVVVVPFLITVLLISCCYLDRCLRLFIIVVVGCCSLLFYVLRLLFVGICW
jgi:hypothetical protein